jgi:heavy metal sensor kinase
MFNSIKLKLVVWFLAVFLIFFAGLEIFLFYKLEDLAQDLADEHLKSELHTLANLMTVEDQHGQIATELEELATAASGEYAEKFSGHYYQIVNSDGKILVLSQSLSLGNASLPVIRGGDEPQYMNVTGPDGASLRMISQSFDFSIGRLTFQAGDTLKDTYVMLRSFYNMVLIVLPIVFLICGAGVFIVTGWGLRSLKAFTAKIGQITEENLSERIPEGGVVSELKPLASNFNTMLGRLEESFSKQKQFLSDASHELRTPTTIIKSFCDITLSKDRNASEYRDAMSKIGDTVNRMCDIINRILVVSRLDSKTIQLKPVRLDLMTMMREVLKLIEPSAAGKGINIDLTGESVTIKGDREGLTEVFTNLVENAVKYNKTDGRIDISVGSNRNEAIVIVSDTGIGIPPGEKEKIFDRFYRVDASRGVTVGSGLGLSIVRTIIEAHGGRVEVTSEPGKGSAFRVYLPMNGSPLL